MLKVIQSLKSWDINVLHDVASSVWCFWVFCSQNFHVSVFSPSLSPWVLDFPVFHFCLHAETNNGNWVITISWAARFVEHTFVVELHISMHLHNSSNRGNLKSLSDSSGISLNGSKSCVNNFRFWRSSFAFFFFCMVRIFALSHQSVVSGVRKWSIKRSSRASMIAFSNWAIN